MHFSNFQGSDAMSIFDFSVLVELICPDVSQRYFEDMSTSVEPRDGFQVQVGNSLRYKLEDLLQYLYFAIMYDEWIDSMQSLNVSSSGLIEIPKLIAWLSASSQSLVVNILASLRPPDEGILSFVSFINTQSESGKRTLSLIAIKRFLYRNEHFLNNIYG
jgi:hypothetical protein